MARQQSMLKYRGSLDGIRHYKIKGKEGSFAAYVTPVSADRIKTGAEFARTRENMNEFGACGQITASFRAGVAPLLSQMADNGMTARMVSLMKKINLLDESEARGYRAILVSQKGELLIKFPYNDSLSLRDVFLAPMSFTHDENRESATLTVEPFSASGALKKAPSGATHYRLVNVLSVLSDFAFDAEIKQYKAVEAGLNEKSVIIYSPYLQVGADVTAPINLTATLTGVTIPDDAAVACIQSVGIEFLQKVGERYVVMTNSTMMIADLF